MIKLSGQVYLVDFTYKCTRLNQFLNWKTPRPLTLSWIRPLISKTTMKRNLRRKVVDEAKNAPVADESTNSIQPKTKKKRAKKTEPEQENCDDSAANVQNASTPSQQNPGEKLDKSFYNQDSVNLAKSLLGKVLCRKLPETGEILKGVIVETEAYPGVGDAASRTCKGEPTPGSLALFMDPGTAYVYFTYGMYFCFNISSKDKGGGCLLRGIEVLEDYDVMHTFRQSKKKQATEKPVKRLKQHELANGPSKLCAAFGINRDSCDKIDMSISDNLWLEESLDLKYHGREFTVKEAKRVGIDSTPTVARNKLYRFFIDENASVSKVK